jgi:raffinose/stachyose/melibiose transport system substrate-binding protein
MKDKKQLLRIFGLMFIILALAFTLISCGSNEQSEAGAPTVDEASAAEIGTEESEAETIELVYWSMWNEDEPQGQVVKSAIEAYEADHPNVDVKVTWYGRDIRNLLGPALEAGEAIDIYDIWAGGKADALDLSPLLIQPALGAGNQESAMTVAESIMPALWESTDVLNGDWQIVGVPYNPFVVMVFYNKDHFAAAGIESVPQTWDEMLAAAESLRAAGYEPFTEDIDAYMDIIIGAFGERALTCEGIIETINDPTGGAWYDDATQRMAQAVADFSPYLAPGTDGNLYPAGQQRVALGEVTMNLNGSWLPSELLDLTGPDFNWGVFSFPNLPNGTGSNTHVESGSQALGINKESGNPLEAFNLIRYVAGFEAQTAMVEVGQSPAARVDVPWLGPLFDAYEVFKTADKALPWACGLWDTGEVFSNVVVPHFTDLFLGKVSPGEFTDDIAAAQADFWASREEDVEQPVAEEPGVTEQPVTLVYWSMWNEDEPQGQVVKGAIEAFMEAHPNVTVETTWYGRDIRNLLSPALEAGETIDVYDTWAGGKDNALELNPYLDQVALGPGYVDSEYSVKESILPALWESVDVQNSAGQIVGLPYNPFVVMVFYNKDHFTAAGIESVPQTWDEMLTTAEALRAAGYEPFTEDIDAYMDIIIGAFGERALTCEGIIDTVNDPSGEAWNSPEALQMAQTVADFSAYLAPGTDGNLYPAGQQRVALGEVTMNLNGSWLPSELLDLTGPDFNWGVFSFPNLPNGAGSNTHVESGSQALGINQASENPDVAFELLRYVSSYEAQSTMAKEAASPAARIDVPWEGPLFDAYQAFKAADVSLPWACGLWDTGEVFSNVLLPNFTDLFVGKVTPEEFIANITAAQADFWASRE